MDHERKVTLSPRSINIEPDLSNGERRGSLGGEGDSSRMGMLAISRLGGWATTHAAHSNQYGTNEAGRLRAQHCGLQTGESIRPGSYYRQCITSAGQPAKGGTVELGDLSLAGSGMCLFAKELRTPMVPLAKPASWGIRHTYYLTYL